MIYEYSPIVYSTDFVISKTIVQAYTKWDESVKTKLSQAERSRRFNNFVKACEEVLNKLRQ